MSRHLIDNRPKVNVAAHAERDALDKLQFTALAIFFAGVFYFFGYFYFGQILWRVLSGG